jgi:hypothetical protein
MAAKGCLLKVDVKTGDGSSIARGAPDEANLGRVEVFNSSMGSTRAPLQQPEIFFLSSLTPPTAFIFTDKRLIAHSAVHRTTSRRHLHITECLGHATGVAHRKSVSSMRQG